MLPGNARRRFQHGSLKDEGDRWALRWREDILDPATGKVKRVRKWEVLSKQSFRTKREAQRELDRILQSVNAVDYKPVTSGTFEDFAGRWKSTVMIHHEQSTQDLETRYIEKNLKPIFGSYPLKDISAEAVQAWVSGLTVGPKTVRNYVATFKLMWKSAKTWGYVQHNPFDGLKLPKKKKAKVYTFSPEQMMAIINEATGRDRLIFEIFAFGGPRPGEQAGLRPEDLKGRVIHVYQAVYKGKIKDSLKSENAEREFTIPEWLAEKIRAYIKETGPNRHGLIFVNKDGKPINTNHFNDKALKPILKRLGIWEKIPEGTRCGNYAFRHGNISVQRNNGVPLATIQARVGHAPGSKVTDTHYVEADPQQNYAAADLLDMLLSPKGEGDSVQ